MNALARIRSSRPPWPWTRVADGERFGWENARRAWLCWLLPYRTAELLDFDDVGMQLGPWQWRAPLLWRAIRARQEQQ